MRVKTLSNSTDKKQREDYLPLIPAMRKWLGQNGIDFFRKLKAEHGRVDAIWDEGGIPHIVHFREGMQIRNYLRDVTNRTWSVFEYDNTWVDVIEECIKEVPEESKCGFFKKLRDWWSN
jgi:hypothetical protein